MGFSSATFIDGGTRCPLGQVYDPTREKSRRSEFRTSVMVPNVDLTPGTGGRWCSASAAGTYFTRSTSARAACVRRRRV